MRREERRRKDAMGGGVDGLGDCVCVFFFTKTSIHKKKMSMKRRCVWYGNVCA